MQDRRHSPPNARPPHETADKNRTASGLLSNIIMEIQREKWASGALVTATILADRFCMTLEEGKNALPLLEKSGLLEKLGPSYIVK